MKIYDEQDAIRRADALVHDEVMVQVGDPNTGQPLLTLSVTKDGNAIVEYEPGALATGIRELNKLISKSLRGEVPASHLSVIP